MAKMTAANDVSSHAAHTTHTTHTACATPDSAFHQPALFLPKRQTYFVYHPSRTLTASASMFARLANVLQLAYYKYLLTTGLYMLNQRECLIINVLVAGSLLLTLYQLCF